MPLQYLWGVMVAHNEENWHGFSGRFWNPYKHVFLRTTILYVYVPVAADGPVNIIY